MKIKKVMLIAIEASGDALAAELVKSLRAEASNTAALQFFGAGGPKMAEAGVELAVDMVAHAVIGLDVVKKYFWFKKVFEQLKRLAIEKQPDLVVCVDSALFNIPFARAIREQRTAQWNPKIVQYVSPQVWASRPGRAAKMARNIDLLLCLFPFEKKWYAERTPSLRVEFVGHPILDRGLKSGELKDASASGADVPLVLLLPGSRRGELKRHLPVMFQAAQMILAREKIRLRMVLPNQRLADEAVAMIPALPRFVEIHTTDLTKSLSETRVAMASTGTVLLECACLGVPAVAMYKASWATYQIGRHLVKVPFLSMPNILANSEVFPEFVQDRATPETIADAALELLNDQKRREAIKVSLQAVVKSLGEPGGAKRAAGFVSKLLSEDALPTV